MSEKNRVKLKICGYDFIVSSEDSEEYMIQTAQAVEKRIVMTSNSSSGMSTSMAAIFAAMEYCDDAQKARETADNLRAQIQNYLEDAARAKSEAAELRRREQSLMRELEQLRRKP